MVHRISSSSHLMVESSPSINTIWLVSTPYSMTYSKVGDLFNCCTEKHNLVTNSSLWLYLISLNDLQTRRKQHMLDLHFYAYNSRQVYIINTKMQKNCSGSRLIGSMLS